MSVVAHTLNSPAALAAWVRDQLNDPGYADTSDQNNHLVRVLIRETDRWLASDLDPTDLQVLAGPAPETTGSAHWDALIEGLVSHRFSSVGAPAPTWCSRTTLDEGWDPYADTNTHGGWFLLDMLETPMALIEKGVTLSRRALDIR